MGSRRPAAHAGGLEDLIPLLVRHVAFRDQDVDERLSLLGRLGYEPVAFSDGAAALAGFEAAPQRFDAVIADEVMPGLTGTELAGKLRQRRSDLPIVLVSGYIGPMMTERAHAAGVDEILKKPVQSRELAAALARVLSAVTKTQHAGNMQPVS